MSKRKNAEQPLAVLAKQTGLEKEKSGETLRVLLGLLCFFVAIYLILAFISNLFTGGADQSFVEAAAESLPDDPQVHNFAGALGARVAYYFMQGCFGLASFFIPIFLIAAALWLTKAFRVRLWVWFVNCAVLMVWTSVALSFFVPDVLRNQFAFAPGGQHGDYICHFLISQIGSVGTFLVLLATAIVYLAYVTSETTAWIQHQLQKVGRGAEHLGRRADKKQPKPQPKEQPKPENPTQQLLPEDGATQGLTLSGKESTGGGDEDFLSPPQNPTGETELTVTTGKKEEKADSNTLVEEDGKYDPTKDLEFYRFPTLDLLHHYETDAPAIDMDEQNANKNRIIEVLRNFGVEISTIRATVGPTITLYEITPAPGVRISKIRGLEDDIALSLSAIGIRIIAPIPGKGTIGIEVPNKHPVIVSMESILNSRTFQNSQMELPIALGKTITNEVYMADLAKLPHLLVAGATGQGKSVGLNAIITSLLYKKHPSELKFVMIDPKKVEFSIYAPIEKHFLAKIPDGEDAIITNVKKVVSTLKSLCQEMDARYDLLRKAHVRGVKEYNDKFRARELNPENGHRFMPYIVVIIDEFGDLIMTAGKDIEMPIARIAQLARAVGIHMVIATQRPTTNIITGTIKANFPARMAFKVASGIDSRTVLDRTGAERLVGRGDMLFLAGNQPVRVQCAFVDTPEVEKITEYIAAQQGYPSAYELPEVYDENEEGDKSDVDVNHLDPMFEQVARLVVVQQQGSTSMIQRKFSIGYNRAGRIMDQLEKAGIVGSAQGSKPREVLCSDEVMLDNLLANLHN